MSEHERLIQGESELDRRQPWDEGSPEREIWQEVVERVDAALPERERGMNGPGKPGASPPRSESADDPPAGENEDD